MKKTLAAILACSSLAFASLAGPERLASHLLTANNSNKFKNGKMKVESSTQNLNFGDLPILEAKVTSRKVEDDIQSARYRDLSFFIKDANTAVEIYDRNANSLSDEDFIEASYIFSEGSEMKIKVKTCYKEQYQVNCTIRYGDGTSAMTRIETMELNPFVRFLIRLKTKPLTERGQEIYSILIDSVEKNQPINLPYHEIKAMLADFDTKLPQIRKRENKKQAFSAMVYLYEAYGRALDKQ